MITIKIFVKNKKRLDTVHGFNHSVATKKEFPNFKQEDGALDGEEIKILKAKCNELITRLQQKQEELKQLNLEIAQLEEQKCSIEENLTQFEEDTTMDHIGLNKIGADEKPDKEETRTQEAVVQNFNQMMETMQTLSKQLENSPAPEKVVRRKSSKERMLDGIKNVGRKVGKFLLMVAGTVILSLAATILFNENLRDMMWEILKECVG